MRRRLLRRRIVPVETFPRGNKQSEETNMQRVARNFFTLAILYALCGMALGLDMSITQDHTQMPVHAHTMVAGFLMSAVFAYFYHLFPGAAAKPLAGVHFWLTAASGIGLLVSLYLLLAGNPAMEMVTAISSLGFYAGIVLFAVIALPVLWRKQGSEAH
jgi:FtsH-binding integral membrane protein